ncbi:MAG: YcaQ family DNA glycosylase [Spirochaetales bacterium]|nr:YcaQ family DNA glycosylase [Spirochaetales bacterium]
MILTKEEARAYLINYQGLAGEKTPSSGENILTHVRKAGCIQYDPLNRTGRNADLVLQSRFAGYREYHLEDLLYRERALIDGWDKMMALWPKEDWPCFARTRARFEERYRARARDFDGVREKIIAHLLEKGPLSSREIPSPTRVDWAWGPTTIVRAVLESMYHRGELLVHHREGTRKFYGLTEDCLPRHIREAPDPYPRDGDHWRWFVRRRVASQGLLWNRSGDGAWLGTPMKKPERTGAIREALDRGEIEELRVEGIPYPLYYPAGETPGSIPSRKGRISFLAPLDNLLWDRILIRDLFGFDYKWEVYTPEKERKYGYYVLPVLRDNRFAARVEPIFDKKRKILKLENWWWEPGEGQDGRFQEDLVETLRDFAGFLGAQKITLSRRKALKEFAWVRDITL